MGGQACILYGAAEFSRDLDLALLADAKNLDRMRRALQELKAEPVYVPALSEEVLRRGHACHFRTGLTAAQGVRIDVMSVLHGCAPLPVLWSRRRRLQVPRNGRVNVLALPDLVQAKKTQRDKDWPMVRRLVEADYHQRRGRPTQRLIEFWLEEGRSPDFLSELCQRFPAAARRIAVTRPLLLGAMAKNLSQTELALRQEEDEFRAADRAYWEPLKRELFQWRQQRRLE